MQTSRTQPVGIVTGDGFEIEVRTRPQLGYVDECARVASRFDLLGRDQALGEVDQAQAIRSCLRRGENRQAREQRCGQDVSEGVAPRYER